MRHLWACVLLCCALYQGIIALDVDKNGYILYCPCMGKSNIRYGYLIPFLKLVNLRLSLCSLNEIKSPDSMFIKITSPS